MLRLQGISFQFSNDLFEGHLFNKELIKVVAVGITGGVRGHWWATRSNHSKIGRMNPIRETETEYVKLELLPNGILVATYKKKIVLTLDMAMEIVQTRLDFTGREPRPVLIYNSGVVEIEKSARHYVSSNDGVAGLSAAAIISDKATTRVIMNIILSVERPKMPVRLFTDQKKAMAWLETFL